jgi:N-acetylglucosaminyldiphosphoundecaprenol N-acetyl-beta-D-mannosaminyltransferase
MKQPLISIDITTGSYPSFVERIIELTQRKTSSYVCVANVHMLVEAHNEAEFRKVVNNATICTPDGMPLVWGLGLIHGISQDRVAGMDLLPDLLKEAEKKSIPVYFYGGTQQMLDTTLQYIQNNFPQTIIAGMHSPPFRPLSVDEEEEIAEKINNSKSELLFVALGCPKQEKWMSRMHGKINMPMIGIGGALPVMVGLQNRAPLWAQKAGMEWFYRLCQEPKRLFKRYAITNSTFLWLLLKAKISNSLSNN